MTPRRLELDAASLKALAHPLRVRMLRLLEVRTRASATSLAAELGESSGTTSYHLRQLARHGFVEEVEADDGPEPGAAGRRPRWWRMAVDQVHVTGFDFLADDDTRDAMRLVNHAWLADRFARASTWFATALEWSPEWQRASSDGDFVLDLDPVQTRALADELTAVIEKYAAVTPGAGARKVDVAYSVFPGDDGSRA